MILNQCDYIVLLMYFYFIILVGCCILVYYLIKNRYIYSRGLIYKSVTGLEFHTWKILCNLSLFYHINQNLTTLSDSSSTNGRASPLNQISIDLQVVALWIVPYGRSDTWLRRVKSDNISNRWNPTLLYKRYIFKYLSLIICTNIVILLAC